MVRGIRPVRVPRHSFSHANGSWEKSEIHVTEAVAALRWTEVKLCEQKQKNGEAVSCTSWAALVNHSYTTEFYWYKLMLCQMAILLS